MRPGLWEETNGYLGKISSNGARLRVRRWRDRHRRRRKRAHRHYLSRRRNYAVRCCWENCSAVAARYSWARNHAAVRYKWACCSGFPASWSHSRRWSVREPPGPPREAIAGYRRGSLSRRSRPDAGCLLPTPGRDSYWRPAQPVRRSAANPRPSSRPRPHSPRRAHRLPPPYGQQPRWWTRQPGARTEPLPRPPDSGA